MLRRALDAAVSAAVAVAALAVLALMVHVIADSSLRTLRWASLRGTLEIVASWWLVLVAFLGLAGAQRTREHLAAPVLLERLAPSTRRHWHVLTRVITAAIVGLIAWLGLDEALEAWRIGERAGAVRTIVWPMRFAVPVGAGLFVLRLLWEAQRTLAGRGEPPSGHEEPTSPAHGPGGPPADDDGPDAGGVGRDG